MSLLDKYREVLATVKLPPRPKTGKDPFDDFALRHAVQNFVESLELEAWLIQTKAPKKMRENAYHTACARGTTLESIMGTEFKNSVAARFPDLR